jgi:hypothetical protein
MATACHLTGLALERSKIQSISERIRNEFINNLFFIYLFSLYFMALNDSINKQQVKADMKGRGNGLI